ncbi:MAG: YlxM family DNA-binding protein [Thermoanaerobacterium sp.]|nr:YlxM family DNA-binding protein [Thermoanaerobacterium sp.]
MNSDFVEMNVLYDFYGSLLTGKQMDIFKMYYMDDYSLGEISQELNISRQGVYDSLKRAESILKYYEDKLGLVKKYNANMEKINRIRRTIDEAKKYISDEKALEALDDIEKEIDSLEL